MTKGNLGSRNIQRGTFSLPVKRPAAIRQSHQTINDWERVPSCLYVGHSDVEERIRRGSRRHTSLRCPAPINYTLFPDCSVTTASRHHVLPPPPWPAVRSNWSRLSCCNIWFPALQGRSKWIEMNTAPGCIIDSTAGDVSGIYTQATCFKLHLWRGGTTQRACPLPRGAYSFQPEVVVIVTSMCREESRLTGLKSRDRMELRGSWSAWAMNNRWLHRGWKNPVLYKETVSHFGRYLEISRKELWIMFR